MRLVILECETAIIPVVADPEWPQIVGAMPNANEEGRWGRMKGALSLQNEDEEEEEEEGRAIILEEMSVWSGRRKALEVG